MKSEGSRTAEQFSQPPRRPLDSVGLTAKHKGHQATRRKTITPRVTPEAPSGASPALATLVRLRSSVLASIPISI